MNKQEMFTKAWLGLQKQNWEKSQFNALSACQYRGPNGMKCAAGHLIPDEMYDEGMEGKRIHAVLGWYPNLFGEPLNQSDIDFLEALQAVHDSFIVPTSPEDSMTMKTMRSALVQFAKYFNLVVPEKDAP